jgi:hypothetical protein
MAAIDNLLRKLGFVRLDRYGLVLTPDDRVMATRHAVLDDGVGGRIVGWVDSDLAASELEAWTPGAVSKRREILPISLGPMPVSPPAAVPGPVFAPTPVPVAPATPVEEDDWEWEIAAARARAEAVEPVQTKRVEPVRTKPVEAVRTKPINAIRTQPVDEAEDDGWAVPTELRMAAATAVPRSQPRSVADAPAAQHAAAPPAPRSTVIPVPQLPSAADPKLVRASSAHARPSGPIAPAPRQLPRATAGMAPAPRRAAAKVK